MATKIWQTLVIIGTGLLLQACPIPGEDFSDRRVPTIINSLGFITVYPEEISFKIGDTIWIEAYIPSVQTTKEGKEVDMYTLGIDSLLFTSYIFGERTDSINYGIKYPAPKVFMVCLLYTSDAADE